MNNPNQLNYTQQLEHRLKMIQDDINVLIDFIDESRMMEAMDKPTKYSNSALTNISNIEIACNLESDESLDWKTYNMNTINYDAEVFNAMFSIYSNEENKDRYGQVHISNYSEYKLKKLLSDDAILYIKANGSKYGSLQTYGGSLGTYKAINPTSAFYQEARKRNN